MTSAAGASADAVELLVRNAELLVVDGEREIPGGWVAVTGGRVTGVGTAGNEPEARTTVSQRGGWSPPGLINTHHHIYRSLTYRNLTRSYGRGRRVWRGETDSGGRTRRRCSRPAAGPLRLGEGPVAFPLGHPAMGGPAADD